MIKEQELIDELKEHLYLEEKDIDLCLYDEEVQMCINALEKQKEKKVIDITPFFSDTGVYRCPKCKDIYTFKQGKPNYCSECGQKLDWSEVE